MPSWRSCLKEIPAGGRWAKSCGAPSAGSKGKGGAQGGAPRGDAGEIAPMQHFWGKCVHVGADTLDEHRSLCLLATGTVRPAPVTSTPAAAPAQPSSTRYKGTQPIPSSPCAPGMRQKNNNKKKKNGGSLKAEIFEGERGQLKEENHRAAHAWLAEGGRGGGHDARWPPRFQHVHGDNPTGTSSGPGRAQPDSKTPQGPTHPDSCCPLRRRRPSCRRSSTRAGCCSTLPSRWPAWGLPGFLPAPLPLQGTKENLKDPQIRQTTRMLSS